MVTEYLVFADWLAACLAGSAFSHGLLGLSPFGGRQSSGWMSCRPRTVFCCGRLGENRHEPVSGARDDGEGEKGEKEGFLL